MLVCVLPILLRLSCKRLLIFSRKNILLQPIGKEIFFRIKIKTMNYKFCYLLGLIACLLASCGGSAVELEGKWINIAQYNIIGQDTIWSKVPIVLEFEVGGELRISELANNQGSELKQNKAKWELSENLLTLDYGNNSKESLEIIAHSSKQLVTKQEGLGEGTYRVYKPLEKTIMETKELNATLKNTVYELEANTIKAPNNKGLELIFLKNKYVFPAYNESMKKPAIWTVIQIDTMTSVLIMDGLTGGMLSWDMVELKEHKDGNLEGEYFYKGKAQELKLTAKKSLPTTEELDSLAVNLVGRWGVQLLEEIIEADTTNTEIIQINADKTCEITWLGLQAKGKWTLAKTGEIVFFEVGPTFNYFRIGEVTEGEIKGERRCRAVPSGEAVPVRLVKQEID